MFIRHKVVFFFTVIQMIWVTCRQERAGSVCVCVPVMGKDMESGIREAFRTPRF